jgi:hypothetical protein
MLWMTDHLGDQVYGFYPFPAAEATLLNAFTMANATRYLLSHERPDKRMTDVGAVADRLRGNTNNFDRDKVAPGLEHPPFNRRVERSHAIATILFHIPNGLCDTTHKLRGR